MFKASHAVAAFAVLATSATFAVPTAAVAFPALSSGAIGSASLPVETAAYFYGGREYCFYPNGWRGPGYYLCGFPQRRGFFFAPGFGGFSGGRGFHGGGGHFGGGGRMGGGHMGGGHMGGGHVGGGHMGGGHMGGGHMGGGHH